MRITHYNGSGDVIAQTGSLFLNEEESNALTEEERIYYESQARGAMTAGVLSLAALAGFFLGYMNGGK